MRLKCKKCRRNMKAEYAIEIRKNDLVGFDIYTCPKCGHEVEVRK